MNAFDDSTIVPLFGYSCSRDNTRNLNYLSFEQFHLITSEWNPVFLADANIGERIYYRQEGYIKKAADVVDYFNSIRVQPKRSVTINSSLVMSQRLHAVYSEPDVMVSKGILFRKTSDSFTGLILAQQHRTTGKKRVLVHPDIMSANKGYWKLLKENLLSNYQKIPIIIHPDFECEIRTIFQSPSFQTKKELEQFNSDLKEEYLKKVTPNEQPK